VSRWVYILGGHVARIVTVDAGSQPPAKGSGWLPVVEVPKPESHPLNQEVQQVGWEICEGYAKPVWHVFDLMGKPQTPPSTGVRCVHGDTLRDRIVDLGLDTPYRRALLPRLSGRVFSGE